MAHPESDRDAERRPRVSVEIAAEAAVWVARLHGPSRSRAMELECLAWQERSAAHREAFERCTETWEALPGVAAAVGGSTDRPSPRSSPRHGRRVVIAAAGVAAAVGIAFLVLPRSELVDYTTDVGGEQRVLLGDGTRMTLNTNTRVAVSLGRNERLVDMRGGEALFEVAHDAKRPFVVRAAGTSVTVTGTRFSVRYAPEVQAGSVLLSVTLLEGRVSLQASGPTPVAGVASAPFVMKPGERVRIARHGGSDDSVLGVDRPNLETITAWQRNEAVFDDVSLADAVAEMNRYNRTLIVLLEPNVVGSLRVSGLYRTGDSLGFARAVASLHGLSLQERPGRLELTKPQQGNRS